MRGRLCAAWHEARRTWDRLVDAIGDWMDRLLDGIGDRAASAFDRLWFGAQRACDACGRHTRILYVMVSAVPGEDGKPSFALRCEPCRAAWHQAIRDYYAHRAAEVAAARYDRERKEAA